jgi:hypothetical protein
MTETGFHAESGLMVKSAGDEVTVDLTLWRDALHGGQIAAIKRVPASMRRTVTETMIIDEGSKLILWIKVKCVKALNTLLRTVLSEIRHMLPVLA